MSIDQQDVVDFMGFNDPTGKIALGISDHLSWEDPRLHMESLQKKIYRYLDFIQSGEIEEVEPRAKGRDKMIQVIMKYPPIAEGIELLEKMEEYIMSEGIDFKYETLKE